MKKLILVCALFCTSSAFAIITEIGASYSFSKKTFNQTNYYQSDSKTASVAFYFWQKVSLELSYTDSFYESVENDSATSRVVQQSTQISGADLIFILTDQQNTFQPYIKGGGAYITKKKQVRYVNANTIDIPTKDGIAPSYGIGLKYKISDRFSVKLGYDVWNTPLDDGTKTDDTAVKAGVSWFL